MLRKLILACAATIALSSPVTAQGCVQADLGGVWNLTGTVIDSSASTPSAEWVRCVLSVVPADGTVRTTSKCYVQSAPTTAITFCSGSSMTVTTACFVRGVIRTSMDGGVTCERTIFRAGAMSRNHEVVTVVGETPGNSTINMVGLKR